MDATWNGLHPCEKSHVLVGAHRGQVNIRFVSHCVYMGFTRVCVIVCAVLKFSLSRACPGIAWHGKDKPSRGTGKVVGYVHPRE